MALGELESFDNPRLSQQILEIEDVDVPETMPTTATFLWLGDKKMMTVPLAQSSSLASAIEVVVHIFEVIRLARISGPKTNIASSF